MSRSFLVSLFEHKAWCNRQLIAALRVPADTDIVQFNIALFTLAHTSVVDRIFRARLIGEEHGFRAVVPNEIPEIERLAQTLGETDAWYLNYVDQVPMRELDDVIEFDFVSDGDHGRMTKAQILAHIIAHGASHRGAIGKMLENMNMPGAGDMVTTFVRELQTPAANVV